MWICDAIWKIEEYHTCESRLEFGKGTFPRLSRHQHGNKAKATKAIVNDTICFNADMVFVEHSLVVENLQEFLSDVDKISFFPFQRIRYDERPNEFKKFGTKFK